MIPAKTKETFEQSLKKEGTIHLTYYGKQVKTKVKESISSVLTEADMEADKEILKILKDTPEPYKQTPVLGGMYLPIGDDLYMAEQGKGAWKNDEALKASTSKNTEENLVAYSFDFSDIPGKTESEMDVLAKLSKRVRNIRSTNSLIDFCYVADGRMGAALNQCTKIWDIAAPWLLIREGYTQRDY